LPVARDQQHARELVACRSSSSRCSSEAPSSASVSGFSGGFSSTRSQRPSTLPSGQSRRRQIERPAAELTSYTSRPSASVLSKRTDVTAPSSTTSRRKRALEGSRERLVHRVIHGLSALEARDQPAQRGLAGAG